MDDWVDFSICTRMSNSWLFHKHLILSNLRFVARTENQVNFGYLTGSNRVELWEFLQSEDIGHLEFLSQIDKMKLNQIVIKNIAPTGDLNTNFLHRGLFDKTGQSSTCRVYRMFELSRDRF